MYVCNCNGIRERRARALIEAGAKTPAQIFRGCRSRMPLQLQTYMAREDP